MKRWITISVFLMLITSILISCAAPETSPTASPTATPSASPSVSPTAMDSTIQPGEAIGDMVMIIAKDEIGQPDIFAHCSPYIAESDPKIIIRTCNVPQIPYIFIGYGDMASSVEELDSSWSAETWQLYLDGYSVDLPAFGFFDADWEEYKVRKWKVVINNPTAGEHKLHYVISEVDNSMVLYDITWIFTVGDTTSPATPSNAIPRITYPALSSAPNFGQHPFTSEKANINFLLYLTNNYGKSSQQKWPLILYLHGMGERGNNLDYLKVEGLPKKLESDEIFPFVVASPQIESQDGYWSADETTNSLFTLLEEIKAVYSIDPDRIYLTGVSLGAGGTWEIGLRYPDRFAALIPVMGYYGYPFGVPDNICDLKNVPIWAFHGAKDEVVPLDAEAGLVNALKACDGDVQFTVYPEAGHDIANEVYAKPDLYTWMVSQTLK
jgi:predicted esterase